MITAKAINKPSCIIYGMFGLIAFRSIILGFFIIIFMSMGQKTHQIALATPEIVTNLSTNDLLKNRLIEQEKIMAYKVCKKYHMRVQKVYEDHLQGAWTQNTSWVREINIMIVLCQGSNGDEISFVSLVNFTL